MIHDTTSTAAPLSSPNLTLPTGSLPLQPSSGWGLIYVHGDDATSFLHAQTTQDFALLKEGQARLGAYCTPKGRMLASFVAVRVHAQGYILVCQHSIMDSFMRRLRMYVLRSKVSIEDGATAYQAFGIIDTPTQSAWQQANGTVPAQAWQQVQDGNGRLWVQLYPAMVASGTVPRLLCVQPSGIAAPELPAISPNDWALAEIASGIMHVQQATADQLVPQMANYESVEGVNFKKGCYPGQEVVARSQFRGAIKRRTYVLGGQGTAPAVGAEVMLHTAEDEPQSVGVVLQAAAIEGGFLLLAALHNSAIGAGSLQVGDAALRLYAQPYALKEDI